MAIINALRPPKGDSLAVTASTGVAACNINGMTLHAFAGFGLGKEPMAVLPHRICESNKRRWRRTQVLIIDESMCSSIRLSFSSSFQQCLNYNTLRSLHDRRPSFRQSCEYLSCFFRPTCIHDTALQEYVARVVRNNPLPFGGLQVIVHSGTRKILYFNTVIAVGTVWRLLSTSSSIGYAWRCSSTSYIRFRCQNMG